MNILLFGYRDPGVCCLEYLLEHKEKVVGVVIPPEDNGETSWCRSVRKVALKNGLLILDPVSLKTTEFTEKIQSLSPDLIFSCYYPKIIPRAILDIATHGGINLHGGLLPKYRGCFSGAWSIINDEKKSGVTMHYMEPKVDIGEIIAVNEVKITNEDTAFSLYQKVVEATVSLFKEKYLLLKKHGKISSVPQREDGVNYYGRQIPFKGRIDWGKSNREIYNFIRALYFPPFKPASTFFKNRELFIWEAEEVKYLQEFTPGKIVEADLLNGLIVETRKGCIKVNKASFGIDGNKIPLIDDLLRDNQIKKGVILA